MKRYEHGGNIDTREILYDFSANINPLGMPEGVREAVLRSADGIMRYPDPNCSGLTEALSRREGIPAEQIVCGNGAADLIYRIVRSVRPGKALICAPTFSEYEKALRENDCRIEYWYLKEEEQFRVTGGILERLTEETDLCFLCSPNNPVGNTIEPKLYRQLAEKCLRTGTVLAADECFLDFTEKGRTQSAANWMNEKLIVLRAFTKIYAVPGLRLGYVLCGSGKMAEQIRGCGQCWSVSVPALAAGEAALRDGKHIQQTVEAVKRERGFLTGELERLGLHPYPSEANFILFRDRRTDRALDCLLLEKKIAIRNCDNYEGLGRGFYRIAVRPHEENIRLIQALEELVR